MVGAAEGVGGRTGAGMVGAVGGAAEVALGADLSADGTTTSGRAAGGGGATVAAGVAGKAAVGVGLVT